VGTQGCGEEEFKCVDMGAGCRRSAADEKASSNTVACVRADSLGVGVGVALRPESEASLRGSWYDVGTQGCGDEGLRCVDVKV